MMALSDDKRRRLVGVLDRPGSDFDGERSAAALLTARMVREAGLVWNDIITEPEVSRRRDTLPADWRADLDLAQRYFHLCTEWELGFLKSIARRPRISTKQGAILQRIATELRARGLS